LLLAAPSARAQSSAAAEDLFRRGRELHEAGRFGEACPKFAESYRLDPASGTLLALAACYEAEGKLASAWSAYVDLAERARNEARNERAEIARRRIAVLEPKLAKLTVQVVPEALVRGLVVKRDGIVLGAPARGVALPVDRGPHVVEASAPGYETFTQQVVATDGRALAVVVPKLFPSGRAERDAVSIAPRPSSGIARPFAIGMLAGAGVAAVAGTIFGIRALGLHDDSNADARCIDDVCNPEGKALRLDARSAGNVSTAFFLVGGALLAGGVVLYTFGVRSASAARAQPKLTWRGGALVVDGSF